ncbi:hypothetical protein MAR_016776, partial [Mya arenaria]
TIMEKNYSQIPTLLQRRPTTEGVSATLLDENVRTELREVAYMGAAKDTFTYPEVPKSKVAEDKEVAEKLIERKKTNYEKMNESLGVPAWFRR